MSPAILEQNGVAMSPFVSYLRRTVAARIGESMGLGGELLVRGIFGHSDSSITSIYNGYGYLKEMRAALGARARELTQ